MRRTYEPRDILFCCPHILPILALLLVDQDFEIERIILLEEATEYIYNFRDTWDPLGIQLYIFQELRVRAAEKHDIKAAPIHNAYYLTIQSSYTLISWPVSCMLFHNIYSTRCSNAAVMHCPRLP